MIVKYGATPTVLTKSSIKSISPIPRMLDGWQDIIIKVIDFEGALYATWYDQQGIHIEVKNDADTYFYFVGTITNIKNGEDEMILVCSPIGRLLSKRNFRKNYIYAEGKLKSDPPYAGSNNKIEVETKDDIDFTWSDDEHHEGDKNRGILLLDKTDSASKEWFPSSETTILDDSNDGWAAADTNAKDTAEYIVIDSGATSRNARTTFTFSGVNVPNGSYIQKIAIEYRFNLDKLGDIFASQPVDFQIFSDFASTWEIIKQFNFTGALPGNIWFEASLELDNAIIIDGAHTHLAKYLHEDAPNGYDEMYLRFEMMPGMESNAEIRLAFDWLKVTVYYETADFSPVMGKITDNGASWIESTDINFVTKSIVEDDSFLIGENTRKIANEVFSVTGIASEVDTNFSKYMARYLGGAADNAINAIKDLEKAYLFDYYTDESATKGMAVLKLMLESSFTAIPNDTIIGHTDNPITSAHYAHDFRIENPDNQYKEVIVYGNSSWSIYATAYDFDAANTSNHQMIIHDDTISTMADAYEIAEDTITFLKSVRKTIKITLIGSGYEYYQPGMKVYATFNDPDIVKTAYPIRRIERSQGGTGTEGSEVTVLYLGMGKTPIAERIARAITRANTTLEKVQSYRTVPATVGGTPDIISIDSRIAVHASDEDAHDMEMDDLTDVDAGLSTVLKSAEETSADAYPHSGTEVEGELHWDEDEEMLLRWNVRAGAWIEIGGGAGLIGGNSDFMPLTDGKTKLGFTIQPTHFTGENGFVEDTYFGACKSVAMIDTAADLYFTFNVKDSGTYKFVLNHTKDNSSGATVVTFLYSMVVLQSGDSWTWDETETALSAHPTSLNKIYMEDIKEGITVAADSIVAIKIKKNANEGNGNWYVYGGFLEKTGL